MLKIFVLDTNVLLHNPQSILSFSDNNVVLPMTVIEELDKFKKNSDELGRNARHIIRKIDKLRNYGSLRDGVSLAHIAKGGKATGSLQIVTNHNNNCGLDMSVPDNRILSVAFNFHQKGEDVIFVSKDINVRLKADALGVEAQDYEKQKVNMDELFSGNKEVKVNPNVISELFKNKQVEFKEKEFYPNEFALFIDNTNPKHTAIAKSDGKGIFTLLNSKILENVWNIRSRSKEQSMALSLLLDPKVEVVTLVGQAGTGKTLLALATGLEGTMHKNIYERMLVSRPIIPLGKDIGYLPGDKDSKMAHWMQPVFDNLEFLFHTGKKDSKAAHKAIDELLKNKKLDLEALTYIRGRSIPRQYVIIDEAQNLSPHEVKTIISRAGEGTKVVLTGDPYQIDNPYLDMSSNGLSYAVERLKDQELHGHITLSKSERSPLAAIAAKYL